MHNHSRPLIPPLLGIVIGLSAVSAASIIIKFIQQENVNALVISAYRLTIASVLLAPFALTQQRAELRRLTRRDFLLIALGGVFLAAHFATWIASLEFTSVASSTVFVSSSPIFVGLISWSILREKIKRSLWLGLVITIIGGAVIGWADAQNQGAQPTAAAPDPLKGNLLALAGAATVAVYLLIGRTIRPKLSLIPYIFVCYSAAALTLLITACATQQKMWGYSPNVYVGLILLAVFPQLIGHSSYNWALRYLSATYVSITILGEPVGSTILALIIFSEVPTLLQIIGGGVLLIGIFIASRE